ncbi:hypothetical protein QBC41DRAFT_325580 [Cercophora samala]|uniref:Uncharacterized protein n=1 Tax=Cercophora samala TaxID=330535 RepID=A0AA39Z965_9PEZI|nr:hypothetical protein QBC41DRAFT_325580 [Cercophora samala]
MMLDAGWSVPAAFGAVLLSLLSWLSLSGATSINKPKGQLSEGRMTFPLHINQRHHITAQHSTDTGLRIQYIHYNQYRIFYTQHGQGKRQSLEPKAKLRCADGTKGPITDQIDPQQPHHPRSTLPVCPACFFGRFHASTL